MDIPISYNFGIFTQGVLGVLGCAPIIYWDIPLYWRKGDIAFCTIHLILLNVATHFLCVCILIQTIMTYFKYLIMPGIRNASI